MLPWPISGALIADQDGIVGIDRDPGVELVGGDGGVVVPRLRATVARLAPAAAARRCRSAKPPAAVAAGDDEVAPVERGRRVCFPSMAVLPQAFIMSAAR